MFDWSHGSARALWTDANHGALGHRPPRGEHDTECCGTAAVARRSAVKPGEWLRLVQLHGNSVVVISDPTQIGDLQDSEADASVTDSAGVTLAIATADCAPIALASDEGIVGAVHAGWKGLQAGVLGQTVSRMQSMGATNITAALGPCIHGECYEFGESELRGFVELWGPAAVSATSAGKPAFDLPAAVQVVCDRTGVVLQSVADTCTACSPEHFSYRARQDSARQVMLVWSESV